MMCLLVGVGNAWAANYELVTSAPSDWSGTYVLVGNGNGNNKVYAFSGVDATNGSSEITVTDGVIYDYKGVTLVVEALTDGGYSVKVVGGDNDGKYISSGSSAPSYSNALKFVDTPHRVDFSMDGGNVVMGQTITNSGTVTMRFNYASDQLRFRFYKSGQQPVQLYKLSNVESIAVTGVSLNATSKTLAEGESFTLTATVAPTNATNKSVTWSSSDVEVATVSKGKVTAVGPGKATITVKTADGNYTATCEVTVEATPELDEYVLLFAAAGSNSDATAKWTKSSPLNEVFAEGYQYISSIAETNNVYAARNSLVNGAKFGSSSAAGTITINLKNPVKATYIVVSAAPYGDEEGQKGFTINGQKVEMPAGQNKVYCEYAIKLDGSDLSTITLAQNVANKGRIYVEYIKLVTKDGPYYGASKLKLTANESGTYYATFSSDKVAFFPEDYIVSAVGIENGKIYMFDNDEAFDEDIVEITGKDDVVGYYVPANTGVLVTSLESVVTYYTAEGVTPSNDVEAVNMLRAASVAKEETGFKFYKLAYASDAKDDLGFYYGAEDGAAFESRPGSAYLAVPAELANAKGFRFVVDDNATAIKNVDNKVQTNAVYNLAGQRVASKNFKGIVIKNGKKMLNK